MRKIREFWIDTNDTNRFSCWDIYGMPQNIKGEFLVREVTETGGITDKSVDEMAHEFVNECPKYSGYPAHMETFKAGHASRQPEIDTLTAKVKRLEDELSEQCRINGMGAQRELALITKVKRYEEFIKTCVDTYFDIPVEHRLGPKDMKEGDISLRARAALNQGEGEK